MESLVEVILAIVDNSTTCKHTTMTMSLSSRYWSLSYTSGLSTYYICIYCMENSFLLEIGCNQDRGGTVVPSALPVIDDTSNYII